MTAVARANGHRRSGPPPWFNRVVLAALRSPARRLVPGACELRFVARRSGRAVALPVQYARDGDRVIVLIGHAADKTWWRSFRRPWPVEVRRGWRLAGTGHIVTASAPEHATAARAYRERFGARTTPADVYLVIEPGSPAP